jgi:hypothetical protein
MVTLLSVDQFRLASSVGAAPIRSAAHSQELTAGSTFADDVRFLRQYTAIVVHLVGPADERDRISRAALGVSVLDMQSAFGSK